MTVELPYVGYYTVELPYVGYYADFAPNQTYKYQPNKYSLWEKHKGLTLDSMVQPMCLNSTFKRPFLSALVEMLAAIRDNGGDARCNANLTPAAGWLEENGYIVPVAADRWDLYSVNILYALTEAGKAFFAQHEAPEYWQ